MYQRALLFRFAFIVVVVSYDHNALSDFQVKLMKLQGSYVGTLPEKTLTTKNERFCMLSSFEICEWL